MLWLYDFDAIFATMAYSSRRVDSGIFVYRPVIDAGHLGKSKNYIAVLTAGI